MIFHFVEIKQSEATSSPNALPDEVRLVLAKPCVVAY
jgi:hypothetical protein